MPASSASCRVPGALALAACLLLSGCYVKVHGGQTSSGGHTATAVGADVRGKAAFSGGRASLSSGRGSPGAGHGVHVSLGKGAVVAVIVGLMLADAVHYLSSRSGAPPAKQREDQSILKTCSCYQQAPDSAP